MDSQEKPVRTGVSVLGIDDQPENIALLGAILEAKGYTFFGTTVPGECFALAARTSPKLVLLDIQMPGMDGLEVCRRMRNMRELQHVPIAFLTGRKGLDDVKAGLAAGGNDFIVKPFDPAKLIARVEHWARHTGPLAARGIA